MPSRNGSFNKREWRFTVALSRKAAACALFVLIGDPFPQPKPRWLENAPADLLRSRSCEDKSYRVAAIRAKTVFQPQQVVKTRTGSPCASFVPPVSQGRQEYASSASLRGGDGAMELEQSVTQHYAHGTLEETILSALAASGKDLDHLASADLAPVDEFHIGGRQATIDFAAELEIEPGLRLLDIGSGLGGASRYFAHERGCQVDGH
jgi:hypothetical protein